MWPVAAAGAVAEATQGREAVNRLLLEELAAREIDAVPAGDAVTLWERFRGRLFATLGPETEAVVEEKSKLLRIHFRNEVATRFRHDALLLPNIQMVGASFVQGSAEWCGVFQGIADPESNFWRKLNTTNYNGTTKALCLVNELIDPEGVEIGIGVGGLELYTVFSNGRFRDLELSELFLDEERNRRAVTLALGPLTPPPPGTVVPSDDPACRSAAYRPWTEQDRRCRPKRVGEDEAKKK